MKKIVSMISIPWHDMEKEDHKRVELVIHCKKKKRGYHAN